MIRLIAVTATYLIALANRCVLKIWNLVQTVADPGSEDGVDYVLGCFRVFVCWAKTKFFFGV